MLSDQDLFQIRSIVTEVVTDSENRVKTELRAELASKKDLERFVTKDYLDERLSYFATKRDLDKFITKEDAKAFATKDDLLNFATKDDLRSFTTKDDLLSFATKDDLQAFATKDDLKPIKRALRKLSKDVDVIIKVFDYDICKIRKTLGILVPGFQSTYQSITVD